MKNRFYIPPPPNKKKEKWFRAKIWSQIHLSSNGNPIISLSIPSSLKLEEDLAHKVTVRIYRHNGCHVLGTVLGRVVLGPVIATIIVRVI